jgi:hypothetical protein
LFRAIFGEPAFIRIFTAIWLSRSQWVTWEFVREKRGAVLLNKPESVLLAKQVHAIQLPGIHNTGQ